MVKPLRLPFVSFLSLSLPLLGVLLVLLTRSARLSPVFAPPLLSRSLPCCAIAGMASKERTSTAMEKYFSFFTEHLLEYACLQPHLDTGSYYYSCMSRS